MKQYSSTTAVVKRCTCVCICVCTCHRYVADGSVAFVSAPVATRRYGKRVRRPGSASLKWGDNSMYCLYAILISMPIGVCFHENIGKIDACENSRISTVTIVHICSVASMAKCKSVERSALHRVAHPTLIACVYRLLLVFLACRRQHGHAVG